MIKRLLVSIAVLLVYIVLADIAGVIAALICDILPSWITSAPLFYAIWFVDGVFCGLLSLQTAGNPMSGEGRGDWTTRHGAHKVGMIIAGLTTLILVALSILFQRILWNQPMASDHYVPDNFALTMTFFIAILGGTLFGLKLISGPDVKHKADEEASA